MAHKKLEKVELASVKDLEKIQKEIVQSKNEGIKAIKEALGLAKLINGYMREARKSLDKLASRMTTPKP